VGKRRNPGWFKRGRDPRRRQFTRAECQAAGRRGFATALDRHGGALLTWLYLRVKGRKRRSGSTGKTGDCP